MPLKMRMFRNALDRFLVLLLVALLFCGGCYHWAQIEPNFANGATRKIGEVRIGVEGGEASDDVEGVEVVKNAYITWPMLTGIKKGPMTTDKLVTIDLRREYAQRKKILPGATALLIVLPVIGVGLISLLGFALVKAIECAPDFSGRSVCAPRTTPP